MTWPTKIKIVVDSRVAAQVKVGKVAKVVKRLAGAAVKAAVAAARAATVAVAVNKEVENPAVVVEIAS